MATRRLLSRTSPPSSTTTPNAPPARFRFAILAAGVALTVAVPFFAVAGDGPVDTATAMLAAGHLDDAIAALQQRVGASADDAAAWYRLCRCYSFSSDWDEAVLACDRAVELAPTNADYHRWYGTALGLKANHVGFLHGTSLALQARNEFERAVALDPANVEARCNLAEFYVEAPGFVGGGIDKARTVAAALAVLAPAKAHWVLGRVAEKAKDERTAELELKAAVEADHSSPASWRDLALFYRHANRWEQMEDAAAHVEDSADAGRDVLVPTAESLVRAEHALPLATRLLQRALSSPPNEDAPAFVIHRLLAAVFEAQGDIDGATREYRAALSMASKDAAAREGLARVLP